LAPESAPEPAPEPAPELAPEPAVNNNLLPAVNNNLPLAAREPIPAGPLLLSAAKIPTSLTLNYYDLHPTQALKGLVQVNTERIAGR